MAVAFARGVEGLDPRIEHFLAERPERNVAASLLSQARSGALADAPLLCAWGTGGGGEIGFFAMRTPPWPLLVSELDDAEAEELVELWLSHDPSPPGVSGVPPSAEAVARAWASRTGGRWRVRMCDAMHVLEDVVDPRCAPAGRLRSARVDERAMLVAWERAFVSEAGVIPQAGAEAEGTVARRLAVGSQHLWEDGRPVSTLALHPQIAGTVRIGPVYTPPEHRRRGYASAAVAAASHHALEAGARRCMLFTDLANATSNKIYAAVGFRRFADWVELEFGVSAGSR